MSEDSKVTGEVDVCNMVSMLTFVVGVITGIIYIVKFAKIPSGYLSYEVSYAQIAIGISIIVNGAIFAYIITRIGSILEKLNTISQKLNEKK